MQACSHSTIAFEGETKIVHGQCHVKALFNIDVDFFVRPFEVCRAS